MLLLRHPGRLSAVLLMAFAGAARAQTATQVPPSVVRLPPSGAVAAGPGTAPGGTALATAPTAAPGDGTTPETIQVTGTRIARPDFEAPNPVVSFSAQNIRQSGATNLTDFLERDPALTNSLDSTRTAGSSQVTGSIGQIGLNLLDLRGLGPNRTLVLVDGKRHVAGQPDTAAVDINAIPADLIQRVDILTGAASAVYGADGVSGVVNFVMKHDFDGISARTQDGLSEHGDAANRYLSLIAGHNTRDGRGNVTLAYEYSAQDALANDDRAELRENNRQYFVNIDNYVPGQPGSYKMGPVGNLRYPYGSNLGYIPIGDQIFRGDGSIYQPGRLLQNDGYSIGGDDTPVAGYVGDILPSTRRHTVDLLAHYDVSDAFKLSLDAKFVQVDATSFEGFGGDYPAAISLDNPFVPVSILAAAKAAGLSEIDVDRNNFDLPRQGEEDLRQTWRTVLDAGGRISDHARYDLYYEYGQTDVRETKINDRLNDRFQAALDVVRDPATGEPTCRSNLDPAALSTPALTFTPGPGSGCVPVNLFGGDTINPASQSFYLSNPVSYARLTQHVVDGSVTGDMGQLFRLPGGPVRFAAGGEYRRESSSFSPSSALSDNLFYQYDESIVPSAEQGHFDVAEGFGELDAPILRDMRFAKLLQIGAAGRYSHYSTVGGTRTYQLNAIYAPVRALSFRGSYGRAVRAPNIGELFQPRTGTSNFFSDPCYVANRSLGTQYRDQNCRTLLGEYGADYGGFTAASNPNANIFIPGTQQGNPNLRAEVARTWTVGMVLRPDILPGFTVALDWYDIRLRDAINTPDPNTLANLCVDQPSLSNVFCSAISRQQGTGYIDGFVVEPQNVAEFETSGAELNASYRLQTRRDGSFDFRLVGGYLYSLSQIATPGAVAENNADQIYRPKYTIVFSPTWNFGPVSVSYTLRWQDGVRRFDRIDTDDDPTLVDPRYFRHSALWEHDIQAQLAVNRHVSVFGGINNLSNQLPDNGNETDVPISPIGRYFYLGASFR